MPGDSGSILTSNPGLGVAHKTVTPSAENENAAVPPTRANVWVSVGGGATEVDDVAVDDVAVDDVAVDDVAVDDAVVDDVAVDEEAVDEEAVVEGAVDELVAELVADEVVGLVRAVDALVEVTVEVADDAGVDVRFELVADSSLDEDAVDEDAVDEDAGAESDDPFGVVSITGNGVAAAPVTCSSTTATPAQAIDMAAAVPAIHNTRYRSDFMTAVSRSGVQERVKCFLNPP